VDKSPEAFRTISEVADELKVPKHVLRFWEAKFAQLKPMKRGGGRRYYRPEDVALLRGIRFLLYDDGYTIRGVQKILREHGPRFVMEQRFAEVNDKKAAGAEREIPDVAAEAAKNRTFARAAALPDQGEEPDTDRVDSVLKELEDCRRILSSAKSG
jgi:DNA-binding transcriptional MerR regulator